MSAASEWARCKPWMQDALARSFGAYTIEDVESGIALGDLQFWAGPDCAIVTEPIIYPQGVALNLFLGGGNLEGLAGLEPAIAAFARETKCRWMVSFCRDGWATIAETFGYRKMCVLLVKELT